MKKYIITKIILEEILLTYEVEAETEKEALAKYDTVTPDVENLGECRFHINDGGVYDKPKIDSVEEIDII